MSRIVLILKKDVAHLWPQILAFVAALVVFACNDPTYVSHGEFANWKAVLFMALPISCWLLVTSLIQEEKPIGDEQYWLTRPFSLADLLAAKAIFLAAFLIAPVFLCQMAVLAATGFRPVDHAGDLLIKQIFMVAWYLLPIAAVASVTRNLGQALLGSLVVLAVLSILMSAATGRSGWNGLAWIRETLGALVALSGSAVVVYLQYTRRKVVWGRSVLAGACAMLVAVMALPPVQAAFTVQSWLSKERVDPQAVRLSFDSRPQAVEKTIYYPASRRTVQIWIPVELHNVPPSLKIVADLILIESPWQSRLGNVGLHQRSEGTGSLHLDISAATFLRLKDQPIRVKGVLDMTFAAAFVGQCTGQVSDAIGDETYCLWNPQVYSPFPTSPWFGPLQAYRATNPTHPVAHIQRSFDLGPLRLADYVEVR